MPRQRSKRPDADWKVPGVPFRRLAPLVAEAASYLVRVHVVDGPHVPWERYPQGLWRDILIGATDTLDGLHAAIRSALARKQDADYEFNLGRGPRDESHRYEPAGRREWTNDFATHDSGISLAKLGLQAGRRFGYWFDFKHDWQHVIEVLEVHRDRPDGTLPRVAAAMGQSPPERPAIAPEGA
jgi:hypothetical protein